MTTPSPEELTELLKAWSDGDDGALEKLTPLVYDELHQLARRYMKGERPDQTLQTTALVHEAYLRLREAQGVAWQDRRHFLAVAAKLMRRVLVDFARARRADKRGGGALRLPFDEALDAGPIPSLELVALDDALEDLARADPRKAEVVELRFFGGFSVAESAEALSISPDRVMRDWKFAKIWLMSRLSEPSEHVESR